MLAYITVATISAALGGLVVGHISESFTGLITGLRTKLAAWIKGGTTS